MVMHEISINDSHRYARAPIFFGPLFSALSPHILIPCFVLSAFMTSCVVYARGVPTAIALLAGCSFGFLSMNALIDARTMKLFTIWTHCAGAIWFIACGVFAASGMAQIALWAIAYGFLIFAMVRVLSYYRPQSLGSGDARLLGVLSGWIALFDPVFILLMVALASTLQLILFRIYRNSYTRKQTASLHAHQPNSGKTHTCTCAQRNFGASALPFGPALVIAGWLACVAAI